MPNKSESIYTNPLSVNEQFFFCGVPLRLDTYSNCSHNCSYCFARALELTNASKAKSKGIIKPADPHDIQHVLTKAMDWSKKYSDIEVEWLRRKVPIHWGGMSDPFQPCERKYKVSAKVMEHLNWYMYPTVISTKGSMIAEQEYIDRLLEGLYAVQITLISRNDELIGQLEPGAPSAAERLKVLEKLASAGIWTACRIQPVIPGSIVETDMKGFIGTLANTGIKHVVVEGYKPSVWFKDGYRKVNEVCGGDVTLEYGQQTGSEFFLPTWRKWEYLQVALQAAHEHGITVGAADNDLRDMGDVECCCGIDKVPGFENYWTYQTARMATIAKKNGIVELDDLLMEWTGRQTITMNKNAAALMCDDITGEPIKAPIKYFVDRAWQLGDQHSAACMPNMKQIYHNGAIAYRYEFKLDKLEQSKAVRLL